MSGLITRLKASWLCVMLAITVGIGIGLTLGAALAIGLTYIVPRPGSIQVSQKCSRPLQTNSSVHYQHTVCVGDATLLERTP